MRRSAKRGCAAALVVALSGVLAGCMGPRPQVPAEAQVRVPQGWREDPGRAGIDIAPDWWRQLGDPALADLVAKALAHNTDLARAATRVAQADARVRRARGDQLPQVSLSATGDPRERIVSQTSLTGVDLSEYQVQASASYDLDLFGKLADQTQAARAQYLAQAANADAVRISVVASVVANYLNLRALDARGDVLEATRASLAREGAMRRHQFEVGQVAQSVALQASAALHNVERQQAQLGQQITAQENALSLLVGEAPGDIARGTALLDLPLLKAPARLPSSLLRRRPDIAAAEETLIAADHSLSASRAAFLPDFSLGATIGRVNGDVFPGAVNIWSVFGSVLAPIFEGGKLRAQEDLAAAQRDEAAFAYRAAVLSALRDVEDDLSALRQSARQETAALAARADARGVEARAKHRFEAGQSDYFTVIDAQRARLQAESAVIAARSARLAASVRLYQALGGGWSREDLEPAAAGAC